MVKTLNFVVDFHHTQDQEIIASLNPPVNTPKAATRCAIFFKTQSDVSTGILVEATAFCTQNDQFVKATGRKIALRKAVASLPREARTEIWSGYLAACKPVRK